MRISIRNDRRRRSVGRSVGRGRMNTVKCDVLVVLCFVRGSLESQLLLNGEWSERDWSDMCHRPRQWMGKGYSTLLYARCCCWSWERREREREREPPPTLSLYLRLPLSPHQTSSAFSPLPVVPLDSTHLSLCLSHRCGEMEREERGSHKHSRGGNTHTKKLGGSAPPPPPPIPTHRRRRRRRRRRGGL